MHRELPIFMRIKYLQQYSNNDIDLMGKYFLLYEAFADACSEHCLLIYYD